jgi:hypothetical protein
VPNRPEKGSVHGIRPDELIKLAPRLKPYLRRPNPTWSEIIDAADWLRHDLDVSKPLWGEACLTSERCRMIAGRGLPPPSAARSATTTISPRVRSFVVIEITQQVVESLVEPSQILGRVIRHNNPGLPTVLLGKAGGTGVGHPDL